MRSLEQERAQGAFACISRDAEGESEEFVALARKLPLMLRINGLLATWIFLCRKDDAAHRRMLNALLERFVARELVPAKYSTPSQESVDEAMRLYQHWTDHALPSATPLSATGLRELTVEAIAYSGWIKRAADAGERK